MGSGVPGRRCATTSAVRSTRRRSTGCGARRACRCGCTVPRKRAGVSSIPPVDADAPKVVWAIDFQFDSTIDGKAIKIASMIDEHTRESLLHLVERSITAERLVDRAGAVFAAAGGPPKVLRMDNGPELVSQALQQFCDGQGRPVLHSAGYAVEQRLHRIVQQPPTEGVPQPQPLEHPVRGPRGHRRLQTRAQPPTPPLGPGLPHAGRVRCGVQVHPHPGGLRDQLNPEPNNPTLNPGGLSNGDSPVRRLTRTPCGLRTTLNARLRKDRFGAKLEGRNLSSCAREDAARGIAEQKRFLRQLGIWFASMQTSGDDHRRGPR